jgi:hypothetical protein
VSRRLRTLDGSFGTQFSGSRRGVPALQQLFRRLRPVDVGAAARWGLLVGLTAFWFIEPYDWIRSTFKNSETDDETKQPK